MAKAPAKARAIATQLETAMVKRVLVLAAFLAIGLMVSLTYVRAETAVLADRPDAGAVAAFSLAPEEWTGGVSDSHEQSSVPCGSVSCCGSACHMWGGFVGPAALPRPKRVFRALPVSDASGSESLSPDTFRPPIA